MFGLLVLPSEILCDDREYTFYLDHGSARGEIVKYLLDNLEGKDLGIKEVFIESV